jgi:replication factor C subunit 3/5
MSDYEDGMDVDAVDLEDNAVTFSSKQATQGKRSAANLPVEAEDTLPWYVLYP